MIIHATALPGAFVIEPERHEDARGWFARSYCQREFAAHGLKVPIVQCSTSFNRRRGTLRGMHYQTAPHAEAKLIRCTRGAIWDVALDLRPDSPTVYRHVGVQLSAENGAALYIPEGCAHGFQTLVDDTEVLYQMSEFYAPEAARGIRYDDPAFGIEWPVDAPILLERDRMYPDYQLVPA
ncbi:MAG TPA: dTDP-4-dehydrorhamnose 3,5-epimerase [Gemmatimonadales bacterium]|nr:dTDP-4-dehydrorhamnose 3,5-epimerase [Gemmatimonadales bacterium]